MLSRYLRSNFVGMEWSTGSGTTFLLRHIARLHSVEDNAAWLDSVTKAINDNLPWLAPKWKGYALPFPAGSHVNPHSPARVESEYVHALRDVISPLERDSGGFDFIQVDGRERMACVAEAVQPGMLRADYGVLLLDNAERAIYNATVDMVPAHWLVIIL